ncbi:prepilin-type N-terminal cleavage/methylation domain-containing protein [Dethiosulfatibacter aminovorans DSM 17477]|uniref:Prepilin-type N-terminal cleavage/methylation domain-containing protein n=1 Tax=Dethiosulfatibacter aminovorans DSM 17477 TaxID=1121476 RepID=A0A1M6D806_9FIRM|nr:prepilin-type N-terminal cleavage/methylation domain-containing protein [Dethiosulfatibacter aminovorans]SHI69367.1 prepilin-type N-terminal cleavage/methylation domain-containing protein [Dethiosulfatibacter aminovorans DSM 17477]
MCKYFKSENGFTLIELLLTVTILSFVIVGFLNLFSYGTSYLSMARSKSTSSVLAQSDANTMMSDVDTTGYEKISLPIHFNEETTENVTVNKIYVEKDVEDRVDQNSTIYSIKTDN